MKNWLKRMGAAALSGVMLLALAACGGNTSTATQDDAAVEKRQTVCGQLEGLCFG